MVWVWVWIGERVVLLRSGSKWYLFSTLTSSKYPNEEPGERRRKVVSTLSLWIDMVVQRLMN
jgi:hypothetical protein